MKNNKELPSFNQLKKNLKKKNDKFPSFKIAVLGDTSTQFLATAIKGLGIQNDLNIDIWEADYNQIEMQVMDKNSEYHQFNPDYTLIFHSTHKLLNKYNNLKVEEQASLAKTRMELIQFLNKNISSKIVYLNYPEIDDMVFGSYADQLENSFIFQLRKLNFHLMEYASANPNFFICDISTLQNKLGRDKMFSPSLYVNTDMVFSLEVLPLVADRILDMIKALRGEVKKCIILDLDNTLWGGIIGDDGIEGIQLGPDLGIGKAFTEFQQWIKKLKNRGVIVAVCSKNTEEVAKDAFENHPNMILSLADIAVFKANWDNKADNIRQIQSVLNIGYDAMVFIDDNPVERSMVRENIPDVCVPEMPEDPANYLEYLYGLNLFETASYTKGDANRTKQYQIEAVRVTSKQLFTDETSFLKSLNMQAEVSSFNAFNIPRIAQLSQRSNQFNVRTIRFTEDELQKISQDEDYVTFSFSLKDKFGDNGLVGVLILEKQNSDTLFVNSWFMSCRVLKRGMEDFMLNTIVDYAKSNGFNKIRGEYIETPKNKLVENHYKDLGFEKVEHPERQLFELIVENYIPKTNYIYSFEHE